VGYAEIGTHGLFWITATGAKISKDYAVWEIHPVMALQADDVRSATALGSREYELRDLIAAVWA
jgi:hypothetical protein